jgi:hypothetical protein
MMLALTQANPALFQIIGDLMVKSMDWPGADEISRRLKALLPPQVQQVNAAGDKADPIVLQMTQVMHQMADQAEHMGAEIQQLRDQKALEMQRIEREWYEAQTKRMDVESKIALTDKEMHELIAQNIQGIVAMGQSTVIEEDSENENIEAQQTAAPTPQAPQQMPKAPKPGAMTRKPNIEALTGEEKPNE